MTMFEFEVIIGMDFSIDMPKGAIIRHLGLKYSKRLERHIPFIWAECDTNQPYEERKFVTHRDGYRIEKNEVYIGTYILDYSDFIGHVYEVIK